MTRPRFELGTAASDIRNMTIDRAGVMPFTIRSYCRVCKVVFIPLFLEAQEGDEGRKSRRPLHWMSTLDQEPHTERNNVTSLRGGGALVTWNSLNVRERNEEKEKENREIRGMTWPGFKPGPPQIQEEIFTGTWSGCNTSRHQVLFTSVVSSNYPALWI